MHTTHALASLTPDDLRAFLGNRYSRQLAHNTWCEADKDGGVGVRFHATRILTFHEDGSFTIGTGGWHTTTTKQRLNALLPCGFRVFAKDFAWHLSTPEGTFPFEDGSEWKVTS